MLAAVTTDQKKLQKACQAYEQYFFSQILKRFDATREDETHAHQMFKTILYETIAQSSKTSLGIADQLFAQMDKKK